MEEFIDRTPEEEPRYLIHDPTLVSYAIMPRNEKDRIEVAFNFWGNTIFNIEGEFLENLVSQMYEFLAEYEQLAFQRDLDEGNHA